VPDVVSAFESFGPITNCTILRDKNTGEHKGSALLTFQSKEDGNAAIQACHNKRLYPGLAPLQVRWVTESLLDEASDMHREPFGPEATSSGWPSIGAPAQNEDDAASLASTQAGPPAARKLRTPIQVQCTEIELLRLSKQMLKAIQDADWEVFCSLVDESLTALTPSGHGHIIQGLQFHRALFDPTFRAACPWKIVNTSIASPLVRLLGPDSAMVCYAVVLQCATRSGTELKSVAINETRIWHQKSESVWKNVHVHSSLVGGGSCPVPI